MTTTPTETDQPKDTGRYWLTVANETESPLDMIGAALTGLLAVVTDQVEAKDEDGSLRGEYDQLEQLLGEEREKLEAIAAVVKKSTSAVSLSVKAILEGQPAPASVEGAG